VPVGSDCEPKLCTMDLVPHCFLNPEKGIVVVHGGCALSKYKCQNPNHEKLGYTHECEEAIKNAPRP
nr:Chain A, Oryctin [Oryctes rhinoceros]